MGRGRCARGVTEVSERVFTLWFLVICSPEFLLNVGRLPKWKTLQFFTSYVGVFFTVCVALR